MFFLMSVRQHATIGLCLLACVGLTSGLATVRGLRCGLQVVSFPVPLHPLRGGTDIKWTPGDDKPNAPFSKRARDEQARREGRDPDAPPPEDWGAMVVRMAQEAATSVVQHPREAAYVAAAGVAGYQVIRIRSKLRQDWPVPIFAASPHMTLLQPRGRYLKNTLLPRVRGLELLSPSGSPLTISAASAAGKTQPIEIPGFSVFSHRVRVGTGLADMVEACSALKAWRMADAVEGMDAIVTRKTVAGTGGVGDSVLLVSRTSGGYVCQPWRVVHCDEPPASLVRSASATDTQQQQGKGVGMDKRSLGAVELRKKGTGDNAAVDGPMTWSLVCAALQGCSMEGEVRFGLELQQAAEEGGSFELWLEVVAATKRARAASFLLHSAFTRLLHKNLEVRVSADMHAEWSAGCAFLCMHQYLDASLSLCQSCIQTYERIPKHAGDVGAATESGGNSEGNACSA